MCVLLVSRFLEHSFNRDLNFALRVKLRKFESLIKILPKSRDFLAVSRKDTGDGDVGTGGCFAFSEWKFACLLSKGNGKLSRTFLGQQQEAFWIRNLYLPFCHNLLAILENAAGKCPLLHPEMAGLPPLSQEPSPQGFQATHADCTFRRCGLFCISPCFLEQC